MTDNTITGQSTELTVTEAIAKKVLATVDAGLSRGLGDATPGFMCVEAAVSYAYGLPHNDAPPCVARSVRDLKIRLNDSDIWGNGSASNAVRASALRRIAIAQLGTATLPDFNTAFLKAVQDYVIDKMVTPARAQERKEKVIEQLNKLLTKVDTNTTFEEYVSFTPLVKENVYVPRDNPDPFGYLRPGSVDEAKAIVEDIVQILVKLGSPGAQFLYLTDQPPAMPDDFNIIQ